MAEVKSGLEGILKFAWGQTGSAAVQAGSTIGYVTGFSYEYTENPIQVYDGTAYAHSKKQRREGKATVKKLFVDNDFYAKLGTKTANETVGRHYVELQVDGIAGTGEDIYCFRDCVLDNLSRDVPETEVLEEEWSFAFDLYEKRTYANRLIT